MIQSGVRSQKSEGVPEKSEIFRGGGVSSQEGYPKNQRSFGAEDSGTVHEKLKGVRGWQASIVVCILLLTAYCLLPTTASAHRVNVYGYAEDGKVFVEGYFVDGTKAMNSLVEVFDAETGEKLLEGKTNKEGLFSFRIPRLTALRLVLTASMGHKNDYIISREEVAEALGQSGVNSQKAEVSKQRTGQNDEVAAERVVVSSEEIERIVERVLERKLQPIKNILLRMQQEASRPGMTEIIGGIGYIMGIMGIVLYFKSRRNT